MVYCDECVVAVDKPCNVLSVPGKPLPGTSSTTVRTCVRRRFSEYWCAAASREEKLVGFLEHLPWRDRETFARYLSRRRIMETAEALECFDRLKALARRLEALDHGAEDAASVFGATRAALDDPELRVVHRLDYETSGVICFARSKISAAALCRCFRRETSIYKEYVALVKGRVLGESGTWTWPIAKLKDSPPTYACKDDGKDAITQWRVLSTQDDHTTRLCLMPLTGRSHQLRVHCAKAGHPILGDPIYFPSGDTTTLRLCLHARRLDIHHPSNQRPLSFLSEPPF